jgi:hypothetical protein
MATKLTARQKQALAESKLKYGDEQNALLQLSADTRADFKTQSKQAYNAGQMLKAAADEAKPQLAQIYKQGADDGAKAQSFIASQLAGLGKGADSYRMAADVGTAGTNARAAQARTSGLAEIANRSVDAAQGSVTERRGLRAGYREDQSKIAQQLRSTAGEAGSYAATRLGQLVDTDTKNALTKRGQDITKRGQDISSKDRAAARRLSAKTKAAKDKADAKGKMWGTPVQQKGVADTIGKARSYVKSMKAAGRSRAEIAELLLKGRAAGTLKDPKTGQDIPITALPAIPETELSTALDVEFHGGVSTNNVRRLHDRGVQVGKLGYKTERELDQKRRRSQNWKAGSDGRARGGGH